MTWVGSTWWELELAEGWRTQDDPECLTVTRSAEGALQLSAAVKSAGLVSPAEIHDFYRPTVPSGAPFDPASFGSFTGFRTHFVEDGVHWHKFWLCHGSLLIFVTYNGTPESWRLEKDEVFAMLRSLRIRGLGAAPAQ